ncbi:phenoloxidase-activating factor 2-like [Scaptodrosophila lebanonensis]|uniref:Phenoloxidase-activating factor 2-like n=1 Tax=Drosophila lebanonensis TaxID=7225 RepID=A0A6J2TNL1_DROLE|nr:phenoloxidase-activating factor 2-like [Scaptodrosophila lebanonensis]
MSLRSPLSVLCVLFLFTTLMEVEGHDSIDEIMKEISETNPNPNPRQEMEDEIVNLFRTELKKVMDKYYKSCDNSLNTSDDNEQPSSDEEPMLCGYQKECVDRWLCRNATFDESEEDCSQIQACCHIDDKLDKTLQPYSCGHRNPNGVGFEIPNDVADEANFGEFPWMVAIMREEKHMGDGALLSANLVLSSIEVMHDILEAQLIAVAGEWNLNNTNETFPIQSRIIDKIVPHFDRNVTDMALMYLHWPFIMSPHIRPICLPNADELFDITGCFMTGWESNSKSSVLKKIRLPINWNICNEGNELKSLLCNPEPETFWDLDSHFAGWPIVCPLGRDSKYRYTLAGLVSWDGHNVLHNHISKLSVLIQGVQENNTITTLFYALDAGSSKYVATNQIIDDYIVFELSNL